MPVSVASSMDLPLLLSNLTQVGLMSMRQASIDAGQARVRHNREKSPLTMWLGRTPALKGLLSTLGFIPALPSISEPFGVP